MRFAYHQIVSLIHSGKFEKLAVALLILIFIPGLIAAAGFTENIPESGTIEGRLVVSIDTITGASTYPDLEEASTRSFSTDRLPKVLIIHADPVNDNLTAAIRDSMANNLASLGWEVEIRSLYEDSFNPVASAEEISFQKLSSAGTDPLVAQYQSLIKKADALVLVYPLWWKQPPAILKGWQDRVFSYGFAYEFVNNSPDSVISLLAGKKILIINVAASSKEVYEDQGYLHYLDLADASLYVASGMELTGRHIIYSSTGLNMKEKKECLDDLTDLVSLIEPSY